jgi:hypothetical protein
LNNPHLLDDENFLKSINWNKNKIISHFFLVLVFSFLLVFKIIVFIAEY